MEIAEAKNSGMYSKIIIGLSVVIPLVVAFLIYMPFRLETNAGWIFKLPHVNAIINSITAILLITGVIFIKNGRPDLHKTAMTLAFILGSLFLVFYVIYHSAAESTPFGGEGNIRLVYFSFLISHIILAAIVVPFVLFAFYFALSGKFKQHVRVVKYTLPIWLYVSVSGVIVYLMIRPYYQF